MALDPTWMRGVLALLAARAGAGALTSLPLQSFDLEAQHEMAFRTLQSGLNTGKIVVRLVTKSVGCDGVHVVTGGTGGLGLLTGRWLAQRGTRSLVLASRSGALAKDTGTEWEAMEASGVTPSLERCDTGEAVHVRRLVAHASSLSGVWHAAGVLADALLPNQDAVGFARVFAPKADGAWSLHTAGAMLPKHTFALFSSVAALLGGAGQANYAAANACLDALATSRRTHGVAAASVQWGAWAEVGMAARGAASERMAAMEASSRRPSWSSAADLNSASCRFSSSTPSQSFSQLRVRPREDTWKNSSGMAACAARPWGRADERSPMPLKYNTDRIWNADCPSMNGRSRS